MLWDVLPCSVYINRGCFWGNWSTCSSVAQS